MAAAEANEHRFCPGDGRRGSERFGNEALSLVRNLRVLSGSFLDTMMGRVSKT